MQFVMRGMNFGKYIFFMYMYVCRVVVMRVMKKVCFSFDVFSNSGRGGIYLKGFFDETCEMGEGGYYLGDLKTNLI